MSLRTTGRRVLMPGMHGGPAEQQVWCMAIGLFLITGATKADCGAAVLELQIKISR